MHGQLQNKYAHRRALRFLRRVSDTSIFYWHGVRGELPQETPNTKPSMIMYAHKVSARTHFGASFKLPVCAAAVLDAVAPHLPARSHGRCAV